MKTYEEITKIINSLDNEIITAIIEADYNRNDPDKIVAAQNTIIMEKLLYSIGLTIKQYDEWTLS